MLISFLSFAFLTYDDPQTANSAFEKLNGLVVAKRTYVTYRLSDFLQIQGLSDEYQPPEISPYIETVSTTLFTHAPSSIQHPAC